VSAEQNTEQRRIPLTGGLGFLIVMCCLAGPAVIGAIGGTAIEGVLGIASALVIGLAVAAPFHWRGGGKGRIC
jgi:hypothetical protein